MDGDELQKSRGIGAISFLTALASATAVFAIQVLVFVSLRKKLRRIFEPRSHILPKRDGSSAPSNSILKLCRDLWQFEDRRLMKECGLDAYFFLRYLKTLLMIFVPIATTVMPVLITINFIDGRGHDIKDGEHDTSVTGLDTLAWGNIKPLNVHRYACHLAMAILIVIWVCLVIFFEFKVYLKIRHDHLSSAEHRSGPSAAILICSIPQEWMSYEALRGVFNVFPGGIHRVWLNRDLSSLSEVISKRDKIHLKLEDAETVLIQLAAKRARGKTGLGHQRLWSLLKSLPISPPPMEDNAASSYQRGASQTSIRKPTRPQNIKSHFLKPKDSPAAQRTLWWQFWRPPTGRYASPTPQERPSRPAPSLSVQSQFKSLREKDQYIEGDIVDQDGTSLWRRYMSKSDRPSHRVPRYPQFPGNMFFYEKVDTIYWCRYHLSRLNRVIENVQKNYERLPLSNSAFVQFQSPMAAHMARQTVMHHLPQYMTPKFSGISAESILWDNIGLKWWQVWVRTGLVISILVLMSSLWSVPIAATVYVGQFEKILHDYEWFSFAVQHRSIGSFLEAIAGVLPPLIVTVLLLVVPTILAKLAEMRGVQTTVQRTEFVQVFYFIFLFVQLFCVVSLASFLTTSLGQLKTNLSNLQNGRAIFDIFTLNIPKASNYFYSYMIIQGLSKCSGTLLQTSVLFKWLLYPFSPDKTPRQLWQRCSKLNKVEWGSVYPFYTTLACISLIYCVIAPLIAVFAIVSFSLLWVAQRYVVLYVVDTHDDTGGLLYPRALNQTFTGLYVMELCVTGLFFLLRDENGLNACTVHGCIMVVVTSLTVLYQILLNSMFQPLVKILPVTFEDEAKLRDEVFRQQNRTIMRQESSECSTKVQLSVTQDQDFLPTSMRSRKPSLWLPRDDLGIGADEIRETLRYTSEIPIEDKGAQLDAEYHFQI